MPSCVQPEPCRESFLPSLSQKGHQRTIRREMLDAHNEQIRRIYAKTVFRYGSVQPDDIQLLHILEQIPQDKGARILDAGCGNGRYALALAERGYRNIVGIDLFDPGDAAGGAFQYVKASLDRIPAQDGEFDFIYSNSVIYHLESPAAGIRELARVLKPGGRLVMSAHSKYSIFTI